MADPERDDQALGEEAVRRGLLTREHLDEARKTQRLAIDAGLPITLAEVLIQRQYLNAVQIETLKQRLREPAQSPSPPTLPPQKPLAGAERPPRTGDSTCALPPHPSPRGSATGPKPPARTPSSAHAPQGPFPAIPSTRPPSTATPSSAPSARRASGRLAATPRGSSKRGSAHAAAVPPGTVKRSSSVAAQAVSPAVVPGSSPPLEGPSKADPNGGGVSSGSPPETTPPVAPSATTPSPSKAGTAAVASARARTPSAKVAAEPTPRRSRTVLWVLLVLLLLAGSNTVTWMVARQTGTAPQTRERSFGPPFEPLAYWLVIGPFPAKSGADLSTAHEPENPERDLTATVKGAKGPLKWKLVKMERNSISFTPSLGLHTNCNAYGLTYIESPSETKAILGIGSDDSVRVWLNGEKVHENPAQRGLTVDQDRAPVTLKKGVNEILIKIGQGSSEWGFAVTLRAPNGKPLPGLKGCLPKEISVPEPPKPVRKPTPTTKPPTKPPPVKK